MSPHDDLIEFGKYVMLVLVPVFIVVFSLLIYQLHMIAERLRKRKNDRLKILRLERENERLRNGFRMVDKMMNEHFERTEKIFKDANDRGRS